MNNVNHSAADAVSPRYPLPDYPYLTEILDEFESDELPVEPDQGPVRTYIPEDPEHDRVVDPGRHELSHFQCSGSRCHGESARLL